MAGGGHFVGEYAGGGGPVGRRGPRYRSKSLGPTDADDQCLRRCSGGAELPESGWWGREEPSWAGGQEPGCPERWGNSSLNSRVGQERRVNLESGGEELSQVGMIEPGW